MAATKADNAKALRSSVAVALLLVILLTAAPSGQARILLEGPDHEHVQLTTAPADLVFEVPFHSDQDGAWSAKILSLPDNPVYNGQANGSLADPDNPTGWYVQLDLRASNGGQAVDRDNNTVAPLGRYVDGQRTPFVNISGETTYKLSIIVHAPDDALGTAGRIPIALLFREGAISTTANGGALESSRAFTIQIGGEPPASDAGNSGGQTQGDSTTNSWPFSTSQTLLGGGGALLFIVFIIWLIILGASNRRLRRENRELRAALGGRGQPAQRPMQWQRQR